MNKNYCYLRVSSIEQNLDRQIEAMKKYDIPEENYFTEKISGKNMDRPELQKLLSIVEKGDTVHIHDFSRLSRSTSDLLKIVETLNEKGVVLISNKENLDTSTPTGKLMLTMIGAINEFERMTLLERQKEGIHEAQKRGVYKRMEASDEEFFAIKEKVDTKQITVTEACKLLKFKTRKSYYDRLKIYKKAGLL